MKTVTYEEFLKFVPCWLKYEDGAERIKAYFDRFGGRMSALDILNLDDVSAEEPNAKLITWRLAKRAARDFLRVSFMPSAIVSAATHGGKTAVRVYGKY